MTAVVAGVTVKIDVVAEQTGADDQEFLERGTAMFDGLYAVLNRNT